MNQIEVSFNYKGAINVIQCYENEIIDDVFNRFVLKSFITQPNKLICTYNARILNINSGKKILEIANSNDKYEKKMSILVQDGETFDEKDFFMLSKDIICPICKEICQIIFNNYKITFFGRKNNHMKENISLKEFEEGQKINISKIICGNCKVIRKSTTDKNKFFYCFDCKINLCPLCKSKHQIEHYMIDDDTKNYFCSHKSYFVKFCKTCKKNICIDCEFDHENHETVYYGSIKPENEEVKLKLIEEKKLIDSFKDINFNFQNNSNINNILKELKDNFEICYNIKKRVTDNYCSHHRHYQALMNLKEMNKNNTMINDLKAIVNQKFTKDKYNNILNVYNNMTCSSNQDMNNSIENEKAKLLKEIKELKELNSKIKKENEYLHTNLENKNKRIIELETLKNKLEQENIKINNLKQKYKEDLTLKDKEIFELKRENKENKVLYQKYLDKDEINYNEINKLNSRIRELEYQLKVEKESKTNENGEDKDNELKQKFSLIKKIINYGLDQNTQIDSYNKLGNKCLLIELVLLTYQNYLENKKTNYLQSWNVISAMLEIDRGDFAPENPYQNCPQSIGYQVTISAPHMHAIALEYLAPYCTENARILDIGSGSAYLTCALSALTNYKGTVIGIEHIPQLIDFGIKNVRKNHGNLLNNKKIIFVNGDGRQGCKEYGPYKAIHVGAAVEEVPSELFMQLDKNGRMFIPVGKRDDQKICIFDKDRFGNIVRKELLSVSYGLLTDVYSQLNPKY